MIKYESGWKYNRIMLENGRYFSLSLKHALIWVFFDGVRDLMKNLLVISYMNLPLAKKKLQIKRIWMILILKES